MAKWWKPAVANLPQLDHEFELDQSGRQQTQVYTNPGQTDSQTNANFQFASTRTPQVPSRWRDGNSINLKRFTAFIDHVIWSFLFFFSSWYRCLFTFSISRSNVRSNQIVERLCVRSISKWMVSAVYVFTSFWYDYETLRCREGKELFWPLWG